MFFFSFDLNLNIQNISNHNYFKKNIILAQIESKPKNHLNNRFFLKIFTSIVVFSSIASIKGETGDDGYTGSPGDQGIPGQPGEQGETGFIGK